MSYSEGLRISRYEKLKARSSDVHDPFLSCARVPKPSRRPSSFESAPCFVHRRNLAGQLASDGERPEPAQMLRTAEGLVDATDRPLSAVDRVVRAVLVD